MLHEIRETEVRKANNRCVTTINAQAIGLCGRFRIPAKELRRNDGSAQIDLMDLGKVDARKALLETARCYGMEKRSSVRSRSGPPIKTLQC
jgi:hypothetical protein